MEQSRRACDVIPVLTQQWPQDPGATAELFRGWVRYHTKRGEIIAASMYRAALVQLLYGYGTTGLNGLGFDEATMRKIAGV